MNRVGLLGGMSWESSLEYYKIINTLVKERLGKGHSADLLMYSFDFYQIEQLQHHNQWEELTRLMVQEATNLKQAGAKAIVICTNTMHKMAQTIEEETQLEVIHIAKATAKAVVSKKINKVLLLGTKFTMNGDFYKNILLSNGISVESPSEDDQEIIHNVIYHELIHGVFSEKSKQMYIGIIHKAVASGVQGVILGCTEIPLLIQQNDISVPIFDTTRIHCEEVVSYLLKKNQ